MAEIPKKITYMTLAGNEQVHPAYESALKRVREELDSNTRCISVGAGLTEDRNLRLIHQ